jgi:hypothetical protein
MDEAKKGSITATMRGNLLFVHGTGVRLKAYQRMYVAARERARLEGLSVDLVDCEWGNALGIDAPTLSIPGPVPPDQQRAAAEAEQQWAYLDDDPLFELRLLAIESRPAAAAPLGQRPPHEALWQTITAYTPTLELEALLTRVDALEQWPLTWNAIVKATPVARRAVEASGRETADSAMALARALFAELNRRVQAQGLPALGGSVRERLVDRLRVDWGFQVFALAGRIKAMVTGVVRERRREWGDRMWPQLGDILLYQANGETVRTFIRKKIESLPPPVYLLAHSLGGIACVDLLALPDAPDVAGLITVGSQAPLLYELGALHSLKRPVPLPDSFPRWLNLYDPNDMLGYVGAALFPGRVQDVEVTSGELPLAAHSAYWNNEATWSAIKVFIA